VSGKEAEELLQQERAEPFRRLGRTPFKITMSGGGLSHRADLAEVVGVGSDECRVSAINRLPHGLCVDWTPQVVQQIASSQESLCWDPLATARYAPMRQRLKTLVRTGWGFVSRWLP
jgi:hypothetical protein